MTARPPARWQALAECVRRGLDPALFFPGISEPISPAVISACSACQVRQACLRAAMRIEAESAPDGGRVRRNGIWGGLTARQRSNLAAGRTVRLSVPSATRNSNRRGQRLGRT